MIEAALGYLTRGLSVIPVAPNKRPIIAWKPFTKRLATEEEARRWWDVADPPGLAIVCGRISGLLVFDVEAHGLSWAPPVARTLTARTQGGGRHYYFRWQEGQFRHHYADEGQHVADLKGEGGYVLAPPTVGVKGTYEWIEEAPLAELPDFCKKAEVVYPKTSPSSYPSSAPLGTYPSRSERLMAIAQRVVRAGGDEQAVMAACLDDPAGSKLRERSQESAVRYVRVMFRRAHEYEGTRGPVHLAVVVQIAEGETRHGVRLTVKLKLPDGRTVRQGVTEQESERWAAFKRALPVAECGRKVWIELEQRAWEGTPVLRVKKWLTRP